MIVDIAVSTAISGVLCILSRNSVHLEVSEGRFELSLRFNIYRYFGVSIWHIFLNKFR